MDFLKKHYEKILLSVVLLGLVGALVFMPLIIPSEQQKVRDITAGHYRGRVVPLPNLDLTTANECHRRGCNRPTNWIFRHHEQTVQSGSMAKNAGWHGMIKAAGIGPQAAVVTKITPLYLALTLDSVETNEFGARYVISVEHQAAAYARRMRRKQTALCLDGRDKNDVFTLERSKARRKIRMNWF